MNYTAIISYALIAVGVVLLFFGVPGWLAARRNAPYFPRVYLASALWLFSALSFASAAGAVYFVFYTAKTFADLQNALSAVFPSVSSASGFPIPAFVAIGAAAILCYLALVTVPLALGGYVNWRAAIRREASED